jgi:hypothetical protein
LFVFEGHQLLSLSQGTNTQSSFISGTQSQSVSISGFSFLFFTRIETKACFCFQEILSLTFKITL